MSPVLVTGGGGFLGSHLVERLERRRPRALRRAAPDYDLTRWTTPSACSTTRGRSSSSTSPPRSAASARTARTRAATGTRTCDGRARARAEPAARGRASSSSPARSAPTRSTRRSRSARTTSGTATRRRRTRRTASRRSRCSSARQAYREQYGLNAIFSPAGEPLRAARQLRPRDLARDPGPDPQDDRGARTRSCSGATARPTREFLYVDDCAEGFVLAAERYDGAEPVNLGTGVETSIRELAETIADLTGFEGEIVWDTSMPNGQPRRQLDAVARAASSSASARGPRCARASNARSPGTATHAGACSASARDSAGDAPLRALRLAAVRAERRGRARRRWSSPSGSRSLAFALTVRAQRLALPPAAATSSSTGRPRAGRSRDGTLRADLVGYGWPMVLAPLRSSRAPTLLGVLPVIVLLQVLVLGPLALVLALRIAERIAGRGYSGSRGRALWVVRAVRCHPALRAGLPRRARANCSCRSRSGSQRWPTSRRGLRCSRRPHSSCARSTADA